MGFGKLIRSAWDSYLTHPIIIAPFFLFGLFTSFSLIVLQRKAQSLVSLIEPMQFSVFFQNPELTEKLVSSIVGLSTAGLLFFLVYLVASAAVESYSIGLAKKMKAGKAVTVEDGFPFLARTYSVLMKKILIIFLAFIGSIIIFSPLFFFLSSSGAFLTVSVFLLYLVLLKLMEYFASHFIILNNRTAFDGFRESYRLVHRKLGSTLGLILFTTLLILIFGSLQGAGVLLFNNGHSSRVVEEGSRLLLYSIVLFPYVAVLKTFFFLTHAQSK